MNPASPVTKATGLLSEMRYRPIDTPTVEQSSLPVRYTVIYLADQTNLLKKKEKTFRIVK